MRNLLLVIILLHVSTTIAFSFSITRNNKFSSCRKLFGVAIDQSVEVLTNGDTRYRFANGSEIVEGSGYINGAEHVNRNEQIIESNHVNGIGLNGWNDQVDCIGTMDNSIFTEGRGKVNGIGKQKRKLIEEDQIFSHPLKNQPPSSDSELEQVTGTLYSLSPIGRAIIQKIEHTASSIQHFSPSPISTEVVSQDDFDQALQEAKLADLKFGLGSTESNVAWDRVDKMYESSCNDDKKIDGGVLTDIMEACDSLNRALNDLEKMMAEGAKK